MQKRNTPVILALNKTDCCTKEQTERMTKKLAAVFQKSPLPVSALADVGIRELKQALITAAVDLQQEAERLITGDLVTAQDLVLLVMPQDIQAPKGRLILPQVQTLRELLDKKCVTMCTTTDQLDLALSVLKQPPKLIITDSQVFQTIYEKKPEKSRLTSFSTLFLNIGVNRLSEYGEKNETEATISIRFFSCIIMYFLFTDIPGCRYGKGSKAGCPKYGRTGRRGHHEHGYRTGGRESGRRRRRND